MKRLFAGASTYRLIQLAMLVILGTAFVTSFKSGAEGAVRLGFDQNYKVALPLVLDVISGAATVIHGRVRKDKDMRRLAAWFVLVPMLLSWGANSVDHAYRAADAAAGWPTGARAAWYLGVILAAGICPVAVAGLLHLSTKYQEFEQRQTRISKSVEAKTPAPKAEPVKTTPETTPAPSGKRKPSEPAKRAQAVAEQHISEVGKLPSVRELERKAGVSRNLSQRTLTALRAPSPVEEVRRNGSPVAV